MLIESLAEQVGHTLMSRRQMLVTAESCTGGGIAYYITAIAGSSAWFDRGFVTYSNAAKQELLGVPAEVIRRHGAVSAQTVQCMAEGALQRSGAQIAVAVSGIAGPGGGSVEKPVGTVFIAWGMVGKDSVTRRFLYTGDRAHVRNQSIVSALQGLLECVA